jgi:thioredoxin 1
MLAPRLESVIAEKKGEVILAKVDIDENTELALDYEVIVPAVEYIYIYILCEKFSCFTVQVTF